MGVKVLVACEFSGVVRTAFARAGCEAWSCDLLPSEDDGWHIRSDVRPLLKLECWDLIIAHPPCTRLCNSGVRWLSVPPKGKTVSQMEYELSEGASLFSDCLNAPCDRIAVENPVMHKYAKTKIDGYVKFSQSIQPWQFGHPETKRTCLWLKGLPDLTPTDVVEGREPRIHKMSPGPVRAKERSRFYTGIAQAMAEQWLRQE